MSDARSERERRMLGALLRIPFQAITARLHTELAAAGFADLSPAQFVVFQHLPAEGARVSELAARAQITKQSMGYLVDYLAARGYVERLPDPADGRAAIVRLTERGWAVDQAARAISRGVEEEWARRLGRRRMDQLRDLLERLVTSLETEPRSTTSTPQPAPRRSGRGPVPRQDAS